MQFYRSQCPHTWKFPTFCYSVGHFFDLHSPEQWIFDLPDTHKTDMIFTWTHASSSFFVNSFHHFPSNIPIFVNAALRAPNSGTARALNFTSIRSWLFLANLAALLLNLDSIHHDTQNNKKRMAATIERAAAVVFLVFSVFSFWTTTIIHRRIMYFL